MIDLYVWIPIAVAILSMVVPFVVISVKLRNGTLDMPPQDCREQEQLSMKIKRKTYRLRYIVRYAGPVKCRKTIRIRPEHYDLIRKVTQVIGRDKVALVTYLDNIITAHFENNRQVINDLYREMQEGLIKNDRPCEQ